MATRLYTKSDLAEMAGKSVENLDRDLRAHSRSVPRPNFTAGSDGNERFFWTAESTRAWCSELGFTFIEKTDVSYPSS